MYDVVSTLYIWTLCFDVGMLKFGLRIFYLAIWLPIFHSKKKKKEEKKCMKKVLNSDTSIWVLNKCIAHPNKIP